MNPEDKLTTATIEDLTVFRRAGPVYRARKAMGLLLPGETLKDFYKYVREWELEIEDSNALENQRRHQLSVRNSEPISNQG